MATIWEVKALIYLRLGRTGYLRNTVYRWSHMINNLASAMFGFIYLAVWQAAAPASSATDPYTRPVMTAMVIMAQTFAWVTVFLPAGLNVQNSVRTGSIALEMARPVPFFPMVMAREAGNLVYQGLFRSVPVGLIFALAVGFPAPASWRALLLTVPSLLLAAWTALALVYTVGLSSLWTTEVRWAHWAYFTLTTLLCGGWIPSDVLPGWIGKVAPYLPFAVQQYYPVRIYLGMTGIAGLAVQAAWVALLTLWCQWLTGRALRRVVVQGG